MNTSIPYIKIAIKLIIFFIIIIVWILIKYFRNSKNKFENIKTSQIEKSLNDIKFNEIENALKIKLPDTYKKVMSNYPFQDKNYYKFSEDDLYYDTNRIIKTNQKLREKGFVNDKWPKYLFAIGDDHCGDYYVINLDDSDKNIYYADHEVGFSEANYKDHIIYKNINTFIKESIETAKEVEESLK